MKDIEKETRLHSLNQKKNRKAGFVSLESQETNKFKYSSLYNVKKYITEKFIVLKTLKNKIKQKPRLWLQQIDFISMRNDSSLWLVEAMVEGFIINFIVWSLIGWTFNPLTMVGWGFAVKQLVSIYWRLKQNVNPQSIPRKNE